MVTGNNPRKNVLKIRETSSAKKGRKNGLKQKREKEEKDGGPRGQHSLTQAILPFIEKSFFFFILDSTNFLLLPLKVNKEIFCSFN